MDIHEHCLSCINAYCTANASCPVEYCQNGCGVSLHSCKWPEHDKLVCPEALVSCSNVNYGCTEKQARKALGSHLPRCPASIVHCRHVHTRTTPARNPGETTLQEMDNWIDEKLLGGDLSLVNHPTGDEQAVSTLSIYLQNSGYGLMRNHKLSADSRQRYYYAEYQPKNSNEHLYRYTKRTRENTKSDVKEISFVCNQIVRRDEFVAHWRRYHVDLQLNLEMVIQRCPMLAYGCTYARQNLVPRPVGVALEYDRDQDTFLAASPSFIATEDEDRAELSTYEAKIQERRELALYGYGDVDESYDVLSQLPVEILLNIVEPLDSVSLWNLSLVSQYMRRVCLSVVNKKGIVYSKWTREEDVSCKLGFTWRSSPMVCCCYCCKPALPQAPPLPPSLPPN